MAYHAVKAIRVLAMADVLRKEPTSEYALRVVYRWYSQRFHTPLHLVERLPVRDVLQAYYEVIYEELRDADNDKPLMAELEELASTDEELAARRTVAQRDEDETRRWAEEAAAENRRNAAKKAARAAVEAAAPRRQVAFTAPEADLDARPGRASNYDPGRPLPALGADAPETQPPAISMSFASIEELDRLSESDGLGDVEGIDFAELPARTSKLGAARRR